MRCQYVRPFISFSNTSQISQALIVAVESSGKRQKTQRLVHCFLSSSQLFRFFCLMDSCQPLLKTMDVQAHAATATSVIFFDFVTIVRLRIDRSLRNNGSIITVPMNHLIEILLLHCLPSFLTSILFGLSTNRHGGI